MEKKQNIIYLANTVGRGELTPHTPVSIVGKSGLSICQTYLTEPEINKMIKRSRFKGVFEVYVEPDPAKEGPSNAYCNCLVGIIAIAMGVIYFL